LSADIDGLVFARHSGTFCDMGPRRGARLNAAIIPAGRGRAGEGEGIRLRWVWRGCMTEAIMLGDESADIRIRCFQKRQNKHRIICIELIRRKLK